MRLTRMARCTFFIPSWLLIPSHNVTCKWLQKQATAVHQRHELRRWKVTLLPIPLFRGTLADHQHHHNYELNH
jgi:hypothetical protein